MNPIRCWLLLSLLGPAWSMAAAPTPPSQYPSQPRQRQSQQPLHLDAGSDLFSIEAWDLVPLPRWPAQGVPPAMTATSAAFSDQADVRDSSQNAAEAAAHHERIIAALADDPWSVVRSDRPSDAGVADASLDPSRRWMPASQAPQSTIPLTVDEERDSISDSTNGEAVLPAHRPVPPMEPRQRWKWMRDAWGHRYVCSLTLPAYGRQTVQERWRDAPALDRVGLQADRDSADSESDPGRGGVASLPAKLGTVQEALVALESMKSGCIYYNHGYWTYEYCHLSHVRQFHHAQRVLAMQNGQAVEVGDPSMEFILGRFDHAALQSATVQHHGPHVRFSLSGGTICDVTGRPREIQLRFMCSHVQGGDRLVSVTEVATCKYEAVVQTSRLCSLEGFQTVEWTQSQPIECRRVVSDDMFRAAMDRHKQYKEQEKLRKAQQKTSEPVAAEPRPESGTQTNEETVKLFEATFKRYMTYSSDGEGGEEKGPLSDPLMKRKSPNWPCVTGCRC